MREVHSVRERERERDGSDVTIVALMAMNLHVPFAKNSHGDGFTLSLAKNSHVSFLLHTSRLSVH